jgi:hypothetical protein
MNSLFRPRLIPCDVPALTKKRLGREADGGYVIPIEVLKEVEAVVTFGVCDEDSFEQALTEYIDPKKVPFYLCDPFVGYAKAGTNDFHFESIGLAAETKENMISWPDFRRTHSLEGKKILLKIDIEGAEWPSMENLNSADFDNVVCLIMEFHGLIHPEELERKCKTFDRINSDFFMVHCHANNNGLCIGLPEGKYVYPDVIECTYVNKKYLQKNKLFVQLRKEPFPSEIDKPCINARNDYPIGWWLN